MSRAARAAGPSRRVGQKFKFFVFDCETSGLDANRDRIVELAVIEYAPGQDTAETELRSLLVNPRRKLTKSNIQIHGITDTMLKDEPAFPEVWPRFADYVDSSCEENERPLLVAHNAQFDVNMLRSELRRAGLPFPDWDVACSFRLARDLWPGKPSRLADLTAKFNVAEYAEHRAGGDVQSLCKVLDCINDIVTRTGESVQQLLLKNSNSFKNFGKAQSRSSRVPTTSSERPRFATAAESDCFGPSPHVSSASSSTTTTVSSPARAEAPQGSSVRAGPSGQGNVNSESNHASRVPNILRTPPRQLRRVPFSGGSTEAETRQTSKAQTEASPCSGRRPPSRGTASGAISTHRSSSGTGQVFITATGECFHIDEFCYGLRKARTKSSCSRSEMPGGLRPCKVCCKGDTQQSGRDAATFSPNFSESPRSIIPAVSRSGEANYYRAPTGVRYHVKFDCNGLRNAKAKIPCDTIPAGLTPCKVCARG